MLMISSLPVTSFVKANSEIEFAAALSLPGILPTDVAAITQNELLFIFIIVCVTAGVVLTECHCD
jgi:hypothetical protein